MLQPFFGSLSYFFHTKHLRRLFLYPALPVVMPKEVKTAAEAASAHASSSCSAISGADIPRGINYFGQRNSFRVQFAPNTMGRVRSRRIPMGDYCTLPQAIFALRFAHDWLLVNGMDMITVRPRLKESVLTKDAVLIARRVVGIMVRWYARTFGRTAPLATPAIAAANTPDSVQRPRPAGRSSAVAASATFSSAVDKAEDSCVSGSHSVCTKCNALIM
jgi:hypothetical protein